MSQMHKYINKAKKLVKVVRKGSLNENGYELLDPKPMAVPIGFEKPEPIEAKMQRLIRDHMSRIAEENGYETFEDAEDFDIIDDDTWDPSSDWELHYDPVLNKEIPKQEKEFLDKHRQDFDKMYENKLKNKKKAKKFIPEVPEEKSDKSSNKLASVDND